MDRLEKIIHFSEDWLITRVLEYAEKLSYTRYASPAFEAWRISIRELNKALEKSL